MLVLKAADELGATDNVQQWLASFVMLVMVRITKWMHKTYCAGVW